MVRQMADKIDRLLGKKLIYLPLIALVTFIIYSNSISAPFTLDDFGSISNNYAIRNPLDFLVIWKFYSNRFVLYYTFSLNYIIHGTAVEGYRITNIILHAFNGFLVFAIIFSILGLKYFNDKIPGKYKNTVSVLSSLIFVCHPVQVNAVTYVVQRTAALAATFYFLAVLFFLKYRIYDKSRYLIFTILSTVFAMFTKENTITIPFMLLVIELLFFLKDEKTTWKKRLLFLVVLFITIPVIPGTNLLIKGYSQSDPDVTFKASTSMDRLQYFYTELNVIINYIKLLFIPDRLNFDYSNDYVKSKTIWSNFSYLSFIMLSSIFLFALSKVKKNKLMAFGILWFFIGLSVESSFISIKDVYFEHRLYFPVVGFILFLIGLIFNESTLKTRQYTIKKPLLYFSIVFVTLIFFYSAFTLQRNYLFSDGKRLWSDVLNKAPNSDRAHCIYATNLLDAYDADNNVKYLNSAEKEFKKAIDLNSNNDTAHCNLAKVYLLKNELKKCIREAETTNNLNASTYSYNNMGSAYEKLGDTDKAIQAYLKGYNLDKKCTFILKKLGDIYYNTNDSKDAKFYYTEFVKYSESEDKEVNERLKTIS